MIPRLLRRVRLAKASKAFSEARKQYLDALQRGDTRAIGSAHLALVAAQTARLNLEIGR